MTISLVRDPETNHKLESKIPDKNYKQINNKDLEYEK